MTSPTGHPSKPRRLAGLTLVELLVTVALLAAAAVGILPGLAVAARVARVLERRSQAYFYAFNRLSELDAAIAMGVPPAEEDTGKADFGADRIDWRLTSVAAGNEGSLRVLRLELSWPRSKARDTYDLQTVARVLPEPSLVPDVP